MRALGQTVRDDARVYLTGGATAVPSFRRCQDGKPAAVSSHKRDVAFYHYDFYALALAKIERGHVQDRSDVTAMFRSGLVEPERIVTLFEAIAPELHRYPAINPESFRRAVIEAAAQANN